MQVYHYNDNFLLENGGSLPAITIAYTTLGKLNEDASNVVWICHALTANAEVEKWWPGIVGEGCILDPSKYFIVCANILGSCYGSSGPLSVNPVQGKPYFSDFPMITIRDMVKAHILLREYLQIKKIELLAGGSMGGYQALEWSVMEPERINKLFLLATSATESAWGIAIHTAQRLAIEADPTWKDLTIHAGSKGLKAARAMGMLTYRSYNVMMKTQVDTDAEKLDNYKATSYIQYQGDKLVNRFNAYSYWLLTKAMDSHHLARGRSNTLIDILKKITQPTLIIGISSDILCPVIEQKHIAEAMPNATLVEIDSEYGHDGFLIEAEKISKILENWL
ncbi:MAG: homoserine O-acetyltransferase [Bacteroidetes bacterium]|nr:homoserine O-acetyltransferase [Bacteroidota bacterium]MBS1758135.1 homoserine O-acetyltransferase [Bacteroidota bacterium]